MSEIDASRVFDRTPIDAATRANHFNAIASCRGNLQELELLLSGAKRELQEAVACANFAVWGHWNTDAVTPTRDQAKALLKEHGDKFENRARAARHLRAFCADLDAAIDKAQAKAVEDMHERSRKIDEAEDMAAFEAHEASEKQRRFNEWRTVLTLKSYGIDTRLADVGEPIREDRTRS